MVLASQGYPGSYPKGKEINIGEISSSPGADVIVFHAGTSTTNNKTVTSGGRVVAVSAYAPTLKEAVDAAYLGVDKVNFDGKTYRRDIAHRYVFQ